MSLRKEFPPATDEVELSLFGPGYGESAVIHTGNNKWVIVDSCKDQKGNLLSLMYLQSIGVNVALDVLLLVVTHAHEDHFEGVSELFDACENATLVLPNASSSEEFLQIIALDADTPSRIRAFREYEKLLEKAAERRKAGRNNVVRYAGRGMQIKGLGFDKGVEVHALSPTDDAVDESRKCFGKLVKAMLNQKPRRIVPPDINRYSVALWLDIHDSSFLLGADLPAAPVEMGWPTIIDDWKDDHRRASVYKVAHHGSKTSFHEPIWPKMLTEDVISLVTPWNLAGSSVPTQEESKQICIRSSESFITTPTHPIASVVLQSTKAKLPGVAIRPLVGVAGQVRLRRKINGVAEWKIERSSPASKLCVVTTPRPRARSKGGKVKKKK